MTITITPIDSDPERRPHVFTWSPAALTEARTMPAIDVIGLKSADIQVRLANTDFEGALYIESSSIGGVDDVDWDPVPFLDENGVSQDSVAIAAAQDVAMTLVIPHGDMTARYLRARAAYTAGASAANLLVLTITAKP